MLMARDRFGSAFDIAHSIQQREKLKAVLDSFSQALAEDTAINRFSFQRQIHERLLADGTSPDTQQLVEWIYADLFESPLDDPWMGMVSENIYTALPREGLFEPN